MFEGYDPDPDEIPKNDVPLLRGGMEDSRDWLSRISGEPHKRESPSTKDRMSSVDNGDEFEQIDDEPMSFEEMLSKVNSEPGLDDDDEFNKLFEDSMRKLSEANVDEDKLTASDNNLDGLIDEEAFNKLMQDMDEGMDDSSEDEDLDKIPGVATNDYSAFSAHVKSELREEGLSHSFDEEETRQLFEMMRTNYTDVSSISDADFSESTEEQEQLDYSTSSYDSGRETSRFDSSLNNLSDNTQFGDLQPQMQAQTAKMDNSNQTMYADDFLEMLGSNDHQFSGSTESSLVTQEDLVLSENKSESDLQIALERQNSLEPREEDHITELKELLPGLPMKRIEKIANEFEAVLGYPSVLRLALVLRENMPDVFGPQCLTRKNLANAKHLYSEASRNKVVDAHLVNAMLQVHTNSGKIEPAIRFYETEFEKHDVVSTSS